MNTTLSTAQTAPTAITAARRVVSLDIFRGLTMAVMIFVNALSGIEGLPWWTYHAHAIEDRMTYVDMVFPFFLFIVGMSMPLSVANRLRKNSSAVALWIHVLIRALSLLVLGLILANAEKADAAHMGIHGSTWAFLALLSAALYLNIYPKWEVFPAYATVLRTLGLIGVVALLAIFRRSTESGGAAWLDFSYPEILGLIALSYFASALLYIPTRRWSWAQPLWFLLLLTLCIASSAHFLQFPDRHSLYIWPFGNGAMPCIIFAGIVTANLLVPAQSSSTPDAPKSRLWLTIAFGLLLLLGGLVLTPFGISKIRATPTWSLYSAGAAVFMIAGLYWLCDIKGRRAWAFLLVAPGSNALLTYLLPDFWYFLSFSLGLTWLDSHFIHGSPAVIKTLLFTLAMLTISTCFTRLKVRLQL